MAFASSLVYRTKFANKNVHIGIYTNAGGDTGGDINTGLTSCEAMFLQPIGASVIATAPTVNETLPVAGSAVTIVTADGEDGWWMAIGR